MNKRILFFIFLCVNLGTFSKCHASENSSLTWQVPLAVGITTVAAFFLNDYLEQCRVKREQQDMPLPIWIYNVNLVELTRVNQQSTFLKKPDEPKLFTKIFKNKSDVVTQTETF